MKFIPLHTRNTAIVYKNALCSAATILVLIFVMLSVMIPVLLVSILSPYSGIAESRILYEQPRVSFQFKSIFLAQTVGDSSSGSSVVTQEPGLIACSSFASFNERMAEYGKRCSGTWYWNEDLDHDGNIDRVHFQLKLDNPTKQMEIERIKSFDLALFFDATLKHKCPLSPPALLTHHLSIAELDIISSGTIHLKAELKLKQYIEFTCPFPGRNTKTHFRQVTLANNNVSDSTLFDTSAYKLESLLKELKANPAYFELHIQETYFRRDSPNGLRILLDMDVLQVPARYHLSVWERLGQFWLYFASFFGISFYVMNKLKDFLFGRHIIRSWEIIPWKKLY